MDKKKVESFIEDVRKVCGKHGMVLFALSTNEREPVMDISSIEQYVDDFEFDEEIHVRKLDDDDSELMFSINVLKGKKKNGAE